MAIVQAGLLLLAPFVVACAEIGPPSSPAAPAETLASTRDLAQPEFPGLPFDDPRLAPVFAELRGHPEWLDEPLTADPTVLALVPGTSTVCLALAAAGGDVFVTIDPSAPWTVAAVGIQRADGTREYTFDPNDAEDTCTFVVFGRLDPWPADPGAIEVTGNADAVLAGVIAEAVHDQPERFGIDRRGVPAVLVGDTVRPPPAGWTCLTAVVFVSGPRTHVVIGTRPTGDGGLEIDSRIVERALLPPEPQPYGRC